MLSALADDPLTNPLHLKLDKVILLAPCMFGGEMTADVYTMLYDYLDDKKVYTINMPEEDEKDVAAACADQPDGFIACGMLSTM
jgi:hypothetical protein